MKKTTLKLLTFVFMLIVSNSLLAQYSGPGEYLIVHKTSGKLLTVESGVSNLIGMDEISQTSTDDSQVFEIKELPGLGSNGAPYYNISCKVAEWDAVRTHSLNVYPTTTSTPTSDSNNTRIYNFTLEAGQTNSYDIDTPQTTTPRIWTYNTEDTNVKYVDVSSEDTKWLLVPLFAVASVDDVEGSSVFISNPIAEKMIIKGLKNKVYQIELFNILGKSVMSAASNGESTAILNTSSISSGMYIVKFSGSNFSFTKKIVKD